MRANAGTNVTIHTAFSKVTERSIEVFRFKAYGEARGTQIKRDLFSGLSKGFGFVEMPGRQHSLNAIAALNGRDLNGKPLNVNEAQTRSRWGGHRHR